MAVVSFRVFRKVKIEGKWVLAYVPERAKGFDAYNVVYKGKEHKIKDGTFYLDYGRGKNRRRQAVGNDIASVMRAIRTQAHVVALRKQGIAIEDAPEIQGPSRVDGKAFCDIATEFEDSPPQHLSRRSRAKYGNALNSFALWATGQGLTHTSQADGKVMNRWMKYMRESEGLDPSTIRDKVIIVAPELRTHGAVIELKGLPQATEKEVEVYRPEMLRAFFQVCKPHEFLVYQTFLQTGMREQELSFMGVDDLDERGSSIRVSKKLDLGFDLKNYQERTIPVANWLTELLAMKKRSLRAGARLMFETSDQYRETHGNLGGKRDKKLLIKLKWIAKRSGLNCGRCVGTWDNKPVTCATHPVCGKWTLHRFRHTYATMMLRDLDIVTVSKLLGHKDVNTTRRYLRALEAEDMQPKIQASTLATMFGAAPRL